MINEDEKQFHTSRTLPYPPEVVFAAFATPDSLAQWWGPEGFSNTFHHFEFDVGGRWTFDMHGPDGQSYPNENVFLVIEPKQKVVIRHDCAPYFTLTVQLAVRDGNNTLLTWNQDFDDVKVARAVKSIVIPANEQNLDRLERVLGSKGYR